jgi:putative DNA primase/helicase
LVRPKWDEVHFADGETYGERTIERAIAGTDEFYAGSGDSGGSVSCRTGSAVGSSDVSTAETEAESDGATVPVNVVEELEAELQRLQSEKETLQSELAAEREQREALQAEVETLRADEAASGWLQWLRWW